jgi:hypothetical protein
MAKFKTQARTPASPKSQTECHAVHVATLEGIVAAKEAEIANQAMEIETLQKNVSPLVAEPFKEETISRIRAENHAHMGAQVAEFQVERDSWKAKQSLLELAGAKEDLARKEKQSLQELLEAKEATIQEQEQQLRSLAKMLRKMKAQTLGEPGSPMSPSSLGLLDGGNLEEMLVLKQQLEKAQTAMAKQAETLAELQEVKQEHEDMTHESLTHEMTRVHEENARLKQRCTEVLGP